VSLPLRTCSMQAKAGPRLLSIACRSTSQSKRQRSEHSRGPPRATFLPLLVFGVLEEFTEFGLRSMPDFSNSDHTGPNSCSSDDAARIFHEARPPQPRASARERHLLPELGFGSSEMEMCSVILES